MTDVMLSIRPKWCDLIARGKKTVEVRKTRPRQETPFKCYIYCTRPRFEHEDFICLETDKGVRGFHGGGMVIGEFICDKIRRYALCGSNLSDRRYCEVEPLLYIHDIDLSDMHLTQPELYDYGSGYVLFGWHISNLTIYEKPKKLHEFNGICSKKALKDCECGTCERLLKSGIGHCPMDFLKRPPQSWCYVEEA